VNSGDGKISLLAEGTNGPHFTIRETGVGPTTHMSTFVQLINALMTIQRFFTEELAPTWPVMVSPKHFFSKIDIYTRMCTHVFIV